VGIAVRREVGQHHGRDGDGENEPVLSARTVDEEAKVQTHEILLMPTRLAGRTAVGPGRPRRLPPALVSATRLATLLLPCLWSAAALGNVGNGGGGRFQYFDGLSGNIK